MRMIDKVIIELYNREVSYLYIPATPGVSVDTKAVAQALPLVALNLNLTGGNPCFQPAEGWRRDLLRLRAENLRLDRLPQGRIVKVKAPSTRQTIEIIIYNWSGSLEELARQAVLLMFPSFNSSMSAGTNPPRAAQVAAVNPDRIVIGVNPLSMGGSSPLNRAQRQCLVRGDDFTPIGRVIVEALYVFGVRRVIITGSSMGAWVAAGIFAASGDDHCPITVERLELLEPVDAERQSLLRLGKNFLSEIQWLAFYADHSYGPKEPRPREFKNLPAALSLLTMPLWFFYPLARGTFLDTWFRYTTAMARGGLKDHLRAGLAAQPDAQLTLGNGSASALSATPSLNALTQGLKAEFGPRIFRVVFAGGHHPIGEIDKILTGYFTTLLQSLRN